MLDHVGVSVSRNPPCVRSQANVSVELLPCDRHIALSRETRRWRCKGCRLWQSRFAVHVLHSAKPREVGRTRVGVVPERPGNHVQPRRARPHGSRSRLSTELPHFRWSVRQIRHNVVWWDSWPHLNGFSAGRTGVWLDSWEREGHRLEYLSKVRHQCRASTIA